jgi:hypothetical protein
MFASAVAMAAGASIAKFALGVLSAATALKNLQVAVGGAAAAQTTLQAVTGGLAAAKIALAAAGKALVSGNVAEAASNVRLAVTQTAVAVLCEAETVRAAARKAEVWRGGCVLDRNELVWPAGATTLQKNTALASLSGVSIYTSAAL